MLYHTNENTLIFIHLSYINYTHTCTFTEAAVQSYSVKKIPLKISQNCLFFARVSFLIKLEASLQLYLKKRVWHRCFSVNFPKFLRAPFLQKTSGDCFCIYCFIIYWFLQFTTVLQDYLLIQECKNGERNAGNTGNVH